jgi:hypothetical protein
MRKYSLPEPVNSICNSRGAAGVAAATSLFNGSLMRLSLFQWNGKRIEKFKLKRASMAVF